MTEVLGQVPAADLRVYVIWLPILQHDDKQAAVKNAGVFDDPRMTHYWDPIATQGTVWNRRLELPAGQLAWNLYVVMPRDATWDASGPTAPFFWSHNLNIDKGIKYNPVALRQAVEQALAGTASPAKGPTKESAPPAAK